MSSEPSARRRLTKRDPRRAPLRRCEAAPKADRLSGARSSVSIGSSEGRTAAHGALRPRLEKAIEAGQSGEGTRPARHSSERAPRAIAALPALAATRVLDHARVATGAIARLLRWQWRGARGPAASGQRASGAVTPLFPAAEQCRNAPRQDPICVTAQRSARLFERFRRAMRSPSFACRIGQLDGADPGQATLGGGAAPLS